jgi:AcrR family transcriptional regulator
LGIAERKNRERAERERRIVDAARTIAERDGWDSVTVRRLADEIEYSQPVLYSHFENRDAIVGAVAVEGFSDLTKVLRNAICRSSKPKEALEGVATAYLAFAFARPAIYEAMFVLPSGLRFAEADAPPELHEAFAALAAVIAPFCNNNNDVEVATEAFWAALHGLAELERDGRIRPAFRAQRINLVVQTVSHSRCGEPS